MIQDGQVYLIVEVDITDGVATAFSEGAYESPYMFSDSEDNIWGPDPDQEDPYDEVEYVWFRDEDAEQLAIKLLEQARKDQAAMDQLVDFVRTPEWSVSMLEDIAATIVDARGDVGPDYEADDERAWQRH